MQKVETTQISINRRMNEHNVLYAYNGVLVTSKRKKTLPYVTTWMNLKDLC